VDIKAVDDLRADRRRPGKYDMATSSKYDNQNPISVANRPEHFKNKHERPGASLGRCETLSEKTGC
jgi:hypothetical protein